MPQTVLLGHPKYFRILHGGNPHTRDRWGRRKVVDHPRMMAQWQRLRQTLEDLGVRVLILPPQLNEPGSAFPANAGLLVGDTVYLSRLNPARAGEQAAYRDVLRQHGVRVAQLPGISYQWEGEADGFPVGDPSGDPARTVYLLTHGPLRRPGWTGRLGWPPYRRVYGFRTDARVLPALAQVVHPCEVIPVELQDERFYHGDTALCAFGPHREHLLVYEPALTPASRGRLAARFGDRLLPIGAADAERFAANAYQVETRPAPTIVMTAGVSADLQAAIRRRGVVPHDVEVSEFLEKGGGSVKCLLLHLGMRPA